MNVKRFTARTSREALNLVKQTFGDEAVVLSNKPCPEGVEVLAMASGGMGQIESMASRAPRVAAPSVAPRAPSRVQARPAGMPQQPSTGGRAPFSERVGRQEPSFGLQDPMNTADVGADVQALAMSTLSFQDYVRDRVLKRRQAELNAPAAQHVEPTMEPMAPMPSPAPDAATVASLQTARKQRASAALQAMQPRRPAPAARPEPMPAAAPRRALPPVLRDEIRMPVAQPQLAPTTMREAVAARAAVEPEPSSETSFRGRRDQQDMMNELRQMKGLIEERFGALAFMEKLQRQPVQARLIQKLLEVGFSPALTRKLVEGCPAAFDSAEVPDENAWASIVLSRNLITDEKNPPLEEQGGVFAMIGSTGVGKTTSTAKLAAAFATRYGASNLGLITLDAYRVGAHEQLRAYGRILGVPVHTAHDRASLEDLLDLLANKKMVLVDTAGMAQRDTRCAELLDMLKHPSIRKLLVVNAAQQGETIEDVVNAWRAAECHGVVLSKIDEAVKLAPALDTMIRHRLKVLAIANGQRVPEDWHRLTAPALVQRAMRSAAVGAWRMDSADVKLIFAGTPAAPDAGRAMGMAAAAF
ncbi:flagellar biosynthesis protein FlhF [Paucibacter sp. R3-3]|uniref:Flagellar biosynthesis protein FlhF n=1 Tax=Roseateles agri TaxID=3098619 RepID=A0ABU5DSR8_9BURK|nr:flagellar biosynthesis protein FlhF [Paucibacter sp. R3-3]MDY0748379.1 flagellar biosynthesis protein FlhF [Paucibacter sp. R3-3]